MNTLSDLLNKSFPQQSLRNELVGCLARLWPHEFQLLCQAMKVSPSNLDHLVNMEESELPSSMLLQQSLLLDEGGQPLQKSQYDRKSYVELNRGMSSAIALLYIMRGDCYELLVEGQKEVLKLTEKKYQQLSQEYRALFQVNNDLVEPIFYSVLFNDLGKNIQFKKMLQEQYHIEENDHDQLLAKAFQIKDLLPGFSKFAPLQQQCLQAMWHGGFNPSGFDTLEYPMSMIANWVLSFSKLAKENARLYLAMKKIEILTDIAGVAGNRCKGATNLTEPVVDKFNRSFGLLEQLLPLNQESSIREKLQFVLLEQAKSLGLTAANEWTNETILEFRICKMLGTQSAEKSRFVITVLRKLKQLKPDEYELLLQEFSWKENTTHPTLWLECIPKFLWLMSSGNNYDFINSSISQSIERQENGLYVGLLILSGLIRKIREENRYPELYGFENNELVKRSTSSSIALFVAYDLVQAAQQASEVNSDVVLQRRAIERLRLLINNGVKLKERYITVNVTALVEQQLLQKLTEETASHCHHLSSIGLADRATYFKVKPFIYQDCELNQTVDITRFNQRMVLPEIVKTFNANDKHTLLDVGDAIHRNDRIQEMMNIRLYPSIRKLIAERGATVLLGSKIELQSFTKAKNEKLILEIEIPSSVKFYIALDQSDEVKVYIAGLVSHEDLIQQLITLKLAAIDLLTISILGDSNYFKTSCKNDLITFEKKNSAILERKNVLIVAGCSLEETAVSTLEQLFSCELSKHKFTGSIVSLTYAKNAELPNLGFIILNLNYGEIGEDQVSFILERFNCIGIFSGSAAGLIVHELQASTPKIGDRVTIQNAMHHSGEVVLMSNENKNMHLHVPTLFVETFEWLSQAKIKNASTVDIETFYILKAVSQFVKKNPKLVVDLGVFISDFVGIKPLMSYKDVFAQYAVVLQKFIDRVLVANLSAQYNNNRTTIPVFEKRFFSLTPNKIEISDALKKEVVVDSIGKYWDKSEFSKRVHTPATIGVVKDREPFSKPGTPRCLHLPIKLPGTDIRIPVEYQHFIEVLQQILNFEISVNVSWNQLYAYLTVDQGFVPRANSQRVPGPHVDGLPRDKDNPTAQLIDHAYLVSNAIPTQFYLQQFNMAPYDLKVHHFFAIFRALSDESRTMLTNPFEIGLMDAYSVHTPTQTLEDVTRTFLRLEFSVLEFDRAGNSINPHFTEYANYPFNYVPRPIPSHLFVPPEVYLNKPITSQDYTHESIDSFGRMTLRAYFTENDRYLLKRSDYRDLDLITKEIMNKKNQGFVIFHQGVPQGFALYQIENYKIKLDTLFTFMNVKGNELLCYMMKVIKQFSDVQSIRAGLSAGETLVTMVVNSNNDLMLRFFLRAAKLAKVEVEIERPLEATVLEGPRLGSPS